MTMRESRMPVPDGVDGMRVDAGVARILGLSLNRRRRPSRRG